VPYFESFSEVLSALYYFREGELVSLTLLYCPDDPLTEEEVEALAETLAAAPGRSLALREVYVSQGVTTTSPLVYWETKDYQVRVQVVNNQLHRLGEGAVYFMAVPPDAVLALPEEAADEMALRHIFEAAGLRYEALKGS
jgi:hypothetical protein